MEKFYLMTIPDYNFNTIRTSEKDPIKEPQKIWRVALVEGTENAKNYMKTGSRCFSLEGLQEIKEITASYTEVVKEPETKSVCC